jgi:squalene-hopene/tetraprenyl-beta-curcumene cyclase
MPVAELDALSAAVQEHLVSRICVSGRWDGGCESRLLESGLALPLLRTGANEHAYQALAKYCAKELTTAQAGEPGVPGPASLVPALVAQAALGQPVPAVVLERVRSLSAGHRQLASDRKRMLLECLLAAVGLADWAQVPLPRAAAPTHRWVSLMLTAFDVLKAAAVPGSRPRVDVLVDAQSPDGSWDQHVLVTIFVLLALTAAGAPPEVVDRGHRFLVRQQRGDGGLPFISNEDTWVSCLGSAALAESGISRACFAHSIRYLRGQQRRDGGWAYAESVAQSDTDDTALCLSLLSRTDREASAVAIRRAVGYLREIRNADGGFPTFVHGADSEAEITAKCLVALRDADPAADQGETAKSWAWLQSAQDGDGGFAVQWNSCETFPVFHVVEAIHRYGLGAPENRRLLAGCAAFLLRLRRPGGGWPMTRAGGEPHPLSTAYALAALARCGPGLVPAGILREGAAVLVSCQRELVTGDVVPDSLGPRPFPYSVPILAPIYTLMAITRLRRLA